MPKSSPTSPGDEDNLIPMTMPAIFGHGNPLNALNRNSYTEAWERIGSELPRPKAIIDSDAATFPVEGVDGGSISMLTVHVG